MGCRHNNYIYRKAFPRILGNVFTLCAKHGNNLASESLATGIYRQV